MQKVRRIEVGDLVQLNTWFRDAWSEVIRAHEPGENGKQMIVHVRRDKYGTRGHDYLSFANHSGLYAEISRVAKPDEVDPRFNNIDRIEHRIRYGTLWDAGRQIGNL